MKQIIDRQVHFQQTYAKATTFEVMYKALIEELGEFTASLGFHDWKVTERDEDNMIVELVDITIFSMNCLYCRPELRTGKAQPEYCADDFMFLSTMIKLIHELRFEDLIATILHNYSAVETIITGKQALNVLRQENGYGIGEYSKIWSGREDNHYLKDVLAYCHTYEDIYSKLKALYNVHN